MKAGLSAHRARQRGAALLLALGVVAFVATLAAGALWRQWRLVEVEQAERTRAQARWILAGGLDWARVILRQDARGGSADHAGEPWAVPLAATPLSAFLSGGDARGDAAADSALMAGRMDDLQSRLNLRGLIGTDGRLSAAQVAAAQRLFELLDLPRAELDTLLQNLPASLSGTAAQGGTRSDDTVPLPPTRLHDLLRLGLSAGTLQRLAPHATWLATATPVNLNTASTPVLRATIAGLQADGARALVSARTSAPFTTLDAAQSALDAASSGNPRLRLDSNQHGVGSRHFEVLVQLRLGPAELSERAVLARDGLDVRVLARDMGPLTAPLTAPSGASIR